MDPNIEAFITENPDWYVEGDELVAGFEFKDFAVVQEKVHAIMRLADSHDHHPTVAFTYNTIEIKTVTHDAGNTITKKDLELAKGISEIVT